MLTSYAQNFEDVILWRALKHVNRGFYIDIGAHDPVVDSVSLAFYEKGWRGVHVEPTAAYAEKLRQARPDETVIQAAIGMKSGTIPFWEFDNGLSTGDPTIAAMHKRDNRKSVRIDVPCMPMSTLLSNHSDRDIHWLKIDVEGMERAVIQSWPPAKTRPWIVVVESTKPNSPEPTFANWEPVLVALGYEFVYFDGLNRFYVSREQLELKRHFGPGPNYFDDFALSGYASAPFCARINAELANLREQAAARANEAGNTSGAAHRLLQGVLAWLTLRPGSHPRRVARRGIVVVARFLLARPRLGQQAKFLLRFFPTIEARLRMMPFRMPAQNFVEHHPDLESRPHLPRRARYVYSQLKALIASGEGRDKVAASLRPTLAYISPLPPEPSGIADYSAELLPELSRHFEIDIVVAQREVRDLYITATFPIRTVDWFRNHADKYDRILYHFGNNIFHQHMFRLLDEIPGVVVLHDFFLSHLIAYMENHGSFPNAWVLELYTSHGYQAVWQRFRANNTDDIIWRYPCNLSVLQRAQGIIVHSANSLRLARKWYGGDPSDWAVIPFPRTSRVGENKMAARAALGFGASDFLVCTFGYLVPTKHSRRLLHAWLKSPLARDCTCHLIFVGENDAGSYGREMLATIRDNLIDGNVRITGWVDADVFRQYLAAADIGIQLRTLSRGETSAAVFDCMNYGLATIVNANGSMADLDGDAVWKLPDDFTDAQLIGALETLWKDAKLREKFGTRAREIILEKHNPFTCAAQYHAAIERFYTSAASRTRALTFAIAGIERMPDDDELIEITETVARSEPPPLNRPQLLLDVSKTCRSELKTGIESAARALILAFLERPPEGFRVEPVYLSDEGGSWHYRYARRFTLDLLACPLDALADDAVDLQAGDVLLGLDNSGHRPIEGEAASLLADYRSRGVAVYLTVNDLLHAALAQHFRRGGDEDQADRMKSVGACGAETARHN